MSVQSRRAAARQAEREAIASRPARSRPDPDLARLRLANAELGRTVARLRAELADLADREDPE